MKNKKIKIFEEENITFNNTFKKNLKEPQFDKSNLKFNFQAQERPKGMGLQQTMRNYGQKQSQSPIQQVKVSSTFQPFQAPQNTKVQSGVKNTSRTPSKNQKKPIQEETLKFQSNFKQNLTEPQFDKSKLKFNFQGQEQPKGMANQNTMRYQGQAMNQNSPFGKLPVKVNAQKPSTKAQKMPGFLSQIQQLNDQNQEFDNTYYKEMKMGKMKQPQTFISEIKESIHVKPTDQYSQQEWKGPQHFHGQHNQRNVQSNQNNFQIRSKSTQNKMDNKILASKIKESIKANLFVNHKFNHPNEVIKKNSIQEQKRSKSQIVKNVEKQVPLKKQK